jgi:ribonuclease HI
MKTYKCYFDGACEPINPGGKMGMGIYVTDGEKEHSNCSFVAASPGNTNNIAEYSAFMMILNLFKNKSDCKIEIFGDSMLVVKQMSGEWKMKSGAYMKYALIASVALTELKSKNEVIITWIPREQNEKADFQSMKAIGFERRKWK